MAKVAFTKLSLSRDNSVKILEWKDQKIEIKQFLPTADKLDLISRIINFSADDHVFYNPCKVDIFETVEIILAYANINVTDKQQEDILKFYDLLMSSGFAEAVNDVIPESERAYIHEGVWATIKELYRYRDSFAGIMEQTQASYKDLGPEIEELEQKISDPKNLTLIKEVANLG